MRSPLGSDPKVDLSQKFSLAEGVPGGGSFAQLRRGPAQRERIAHLLVLRDVRSVTRGGILADVDRIANELVEIVRRLHARNLAVGTGGNFSAVGDAGLVITASGVDKGTLTIDQLVVVDANGVVIEGNGKPSAETSIHLGLVARGARAVLHVHSVWNTLLSSNHTNELVITGFEMLKGLSGVTTHEHHERVPVIANSQDVPHLARQIERTITPSTHGVLVAGHGLTTWGASLAEAFRHVEIFEFLFEVVGRQQFGR